MSLFARFTFLPSLGYNLIKNRWSKWNWFDRIDDTVVLGALPFHGAVTFELYHYQRIRSVVSMNENFELLFGVTNKQQWNMLNVKYLQLNTSDIFHAPKLSQLIQGVEFIEKQKHASNNNEYSKKLNKKLDDERIFEPSSILKKWPIQNSGQVLKMNNWEDNQKIQANDSVYVHCKAGRTRSATLVACYLIKRYQQTPEQSINLLKQLRQQVLLKGIQMNAIENYYHHLLMTKVAEI